ncbi:MAG: NAD(P)-binding protein [Thermodesulfobacteriota bacterium]
MEELPVIPITIGDMRFNRTGLWRFLTPVVRDQSAPCRRACPLGMPTPAFINDLIAADVVQALARILEVNPLPGVTGRLCYHPCQTDCLRRSLDRPVRIQLLEQYVADTTPAPVGDRERDGTKGRGALLGAGPLGLTAAYFLARAGLRVTVFDPLDRPGGFLIGLEEKQLPTGVLARETARLAWLAGLEMRLNADPGTFGDAEPDVAWDLILYDRTAHPAGGKEAALLAGMAERLSRSHTVLDTEDLSPAQGYKASQVALAVAAGRELAARALRALGLEDEVPIGASGPSAGPVSREELRYDVLAAQAGRDTGARNEVSSPAQAREEAELCFSCGRCNLCGRCLLFCPDVSIRADEERQRPIVDLEHCKGCGICARECPRRVIVMERVS